MRRAPPRASPRAPPLSPPLPSPSLTARRRLRPAAVGLAYTTLGVLDPSRDAATLTVKDFLHQPPLAPGHALRRSEQVVKIGEGTFSLISHLGDGKGSPRKGEPKSPALAAVAGASSSSGS